MWPAYLRGLAYLDQGASTEARAEFQKILDHKGVLAPKEFNPVGITLYPLAYLGRARAAARTGDIDESRRSYEALLVLWKDADPDIPILRAAKREYRQLGSPAALGINGSSAAARPGRGRRGSASPSAACTGAGTWPAGRGRSTAARR